MLFEIGNEFKTDSIAPECWIQIGGIVEIRSVGTIQVLENLLARSLKHGANKNSAFGTEALQSQRTTSTNELQQHRLRNVICVMGKGYAGKFVLRRDLQD